MSGLAPYLHDFCKQGPLGCPLPQSIFQCPAVSEGPAYQRGQIHDTQRAPRWVPRAWPALAAGSRVWDAHPFSNSLVFASTLNVDAPPWEPCLAASGGSEPSLGTVICLDDLVPCLLGGLDFPAAGPNRSPEVLGSCSSAMAGAAAGSLRGVWSSPEFRARVRRDASRDISFQIPRFNALNSGSRRRFAFEDVQMVFS